MLENNISLNDKPVSQRLKDDKDVIMETLNTREDYSDYIKTFLQEREREFIIMQERLAKKAKEVIPDRYWGERLAQNMRDDALNLARVSRNDPNNWQLKKIYETIAGTIEKELDGEPKQKGLINSIKGMFKRDKEPM